MLSQEWQAVVGPMLESKDDWVHGIVGVVNALGWGIWTIAEFVPNERLDVSIANGYESHGI